ncbi:MAG: GLPGLI family protein [Bacteroidales bacterium]|nr:GLPGLI family protein [Bacteroidales bacterium]
MKRILLLSILLAVSAGASAQTYRVSYSYYYKFEATDEGYRSDTNMKLDIDRGRTVFYSEGRYCRDSLMRLAFDENGDTKDQAIMGELYSGKYRGVDDATFMDFDSGKFTQSYKYLWNLINGEGDLEMPQWEITDETEVSSTGYTVRKAVANYMGRKWTAWYTEEVPLPYGPWLFYGLPGLVITATDSEELFAFKYMDMKEIDPSENRYKPLWDYRHGQNNRTHDDNIYNYSLEDAEKMYTRLHSDGSYRAEMFGLGSDPMGGTATYPDGRVEQAKVPGYIPLIPSKYFRSKRKTNTSDNTGLGDN